MPMVPGGGGPVDPGAALAMTVVAVGGAVGTVRAEAPGPNAAAAVAEVAIGGAAAAVEFPMCPADRRRLSMEEMFKPPPPVLLLLFPLLMFGAIIRRRGLYSPPGCGESSLLSWTFDCEMCRGLPLKKDPNIVALEEGESFPGTSIQIFFQLSSSMARRANGGQEPTCFTNQISGENSNSGAPVRRNCTRGSENCLIGYTFYKITAS